MTERTNVAGSLATSAGRAGRSFRFRLGFTLVAVACLHLAGVGLLLSGTLGGLAGTLTVGLAAVAYLRGLVHAFDFDHVSMIDNSTRKFVAEGRDPASVGLAFSAGHSTVVIVTGILTIAGVGTIRSALTGDSQIATVLGAIGLVVSGSYLILVAISNLATFIQAWRLRQQLRREPDSHIAAEALTPRGPAARIMKAPLRRVRHPRHIYVIGFLFSLGFDTSSQIGLLILTASATLAGAPAIPMLSLPILFAAAMTLGDTLNGLMILKIYETAQTNPGRKINYNLVVTGVSVVSGLAVGVLAISALLAEHGGLSTAPLTALAEVNTDYAGYLLAALFALIGATAWLRWRRGHG